MRIEKLNIMKNINSAGKLLLFGNLIIFLLTFLSAPEFAKIISVEIAYFGSLFGFLLILIGCYKLIKAK